MIAAGSEGEEIDDHEVEKSTGLLKRFAGVAPGTGEQPVGQIRTADKTGDKVLSINMKFRSDILTTGQDPIMLIRELKGTRRDPRITGVHGCNTRFLQPVTDNLLYILEVILRTTKPLSDIHNVFIFVMDENDITIVDISSQYKGSRPHPRREAHWRDSGGEGLVKEDDVLEALKEHKTTGQALVEKGKISREAVEKMALAQAQSRKITKSATIRVDTDKLDKLVNLVGEMVISVARMTQCASEVTDSSLSRTLQGATSALERISRDLQRNRSCGSGWCPSKGPSTVFAGWSGTCPSNSAKR